MWGIMAGEHIAEIKSNVQRSFYENFDLVGLKAFIIFWAFLVIVVALFINNKWVLAGIIAYDVLP